MNNMFIITDDQQEKLTLWQKEVSKRAYIKQNLNHNDFLITNNEPYYGTIGGGYTYHFMPTSLGTVLTVTEFITGETINLTNYDNW